MTSHPNFDRAQAILDASRRGDYAPAFDNFTDDIVMENGPGAGPWHRGSGKDDLALMQLTSGSTGSPKAVHITHRNIYSNAEAMFIGAKMDPSGNDVMLSWLPCFHDMGMVGFLTVPMYFGVELVKVTPMDFLRDTLLWAKLIDKYGGTMTAAPNFAYALFAKRLRRQAKPGEYDLSTLRFALSGAEPVEPADVEAGYALACQSHPAAGRVVLDFDQ